MKKILLFILVVFLASGVNAQNIYYKWAANFNNSSTFGRSIKIDKNENVYVAGHFNGVVDFDPSATVYNVTSNGNNDIFILKMDKNGQLLWAKNLGGSGIDVIWSIELDTLGNVYSTGSYTGVADFDPDGSVYNLTSNSSTFKNIFISKLDSNGHFVWAKGILGNNANTGRGITLDKNNNVLVTGGFNVVSDFDPGPNVFNLTPQMSTDIFVLKLNQNGDFIWAKAITGNGSGEGQNITTDSTNNIYYTSMYTQTCDFDPGAGQYLLVGNNSQDIATSKLDSNGNFIWAKTFNGIGYDVVTSIKLDNNNNIYMSGSFQDSIDFNPDPLNNQIFHSFGNNDAFILKLNSQGNYVFAKQFGGIGNDASNSLALDSSNNIYHVGVFTGTADFDPSNSTSYTLSATNSNIFLSKLDNNGAFISAYDFGAPSGYGQAYGLDFKNPSIVLTGTFGGTVDFNPSSLSNLLVGSNESFVLKLSLCNLILNTINETNCKSYIFNNQTLTTSGTYIDTLLNSTGCDSIITLNLTINNANTATTQNGTQLTATATGATYQWLTCNPYTVIAGATNQTYTATTNGDYAVVVTQNGCTDTSNCITVNSVGINEVNSQNILTISPNPTHSIFEIKGASNGAIVTLYNTFGQKLLTSKTENQTPVIDISHLANGIYFAEIIEGNQTSRIKVIKQ